MCSATGRNRTIWATEYAEQGLHDWAEARHMLASLEWARKWPCEEVWKARKTR
jgi:hypothetical protein